MPSVNSAVVALEYQHNQTPKVIRKGIKKCALAILRDARRYGVPIVTDRDLSKCLEGVYLEEEIPEELYGPVAKYLLELKLA